MQWSVAIAMVSLLSLLGNYGKLPISFPQWDQQGHDTSSVSPLIPGWIFSLRFDPRVQEFPLWCNGTGSIFAALGCSFDARDKLLPFCLLSSSLQVSCADRGKKGLQKQIPSSPHPTVWALIFAVSRKQAARRAAPQGQASRSWHH